MGVVDWTVGVTEWIVGAPAATLRRLQDGGSPDNSGGTGESSLIHFII